MPMMETEDMRLCKEAKFGPMSMLFLWPFPPGSQETNRGQSESLFPSPVESDSAFLLWNSEAREDFPPASVSV
jgi:hypothetical protein